MVDDIVMERSVTQGTENSPYIFIEHTADIRMEVRGKSPAELFYNSAMGLREIIAPGFRSEPSQAITVVLEEGDTEQLLVSWLRELLFFFVARKLVPGKIDVQDIGDRHIKAVISAGHLPDEFEPELEVKAVTYHGLTIETDDEGYKARVIFDI